MSVIIICTVNISYNLIFTLLIITAIFFKKFSIQNKIKKLTTKLTKPSPQEEPSAAGAVALQ